MKSDFSRKLISAKKRAGVTRCSHATTSWCSGNRFHITANKRAGVTLCPHTTTRWCSGNRFHISANKRAGITPCPHTTTRWSGKSLWRPSTLMSPPTATEQRVCSKDIRCRHKGLPISADYFRKGNTLPNCYLFHKTCNDCRSTGGRIAKAYTFPGNVPSSSSSVVPKKKCRKCKCK